MVIALSSCILFSVLILLLNKSWTDLWNFIYEERGGTVALLFAIMGCIVSFIALLRRSRPSQIVTIPQKKSLLLPTFEVENIKQLEEVANTKPFLENPVVGKFIKERKTWNDIKKEVDFSILQPLDLSDSRRIFLITGKLGIGKTTYMLWRIDELLRSKSFKKIIFLNLNAYEHWAEELSKYESEKTLLVIDALRRRGDNDEDFKRRSRYLFRLTTGEESRGGSIIGPFKVLITIRDDEYGYLIRQKEFEQIFESVFKYEITPQKLDLGAILKKYLNSYEVRYNIPVNKEKAVIRLLVSKSEGVPFYIRHLIFDLRTTNRSFSERVLNEFPTGMVNLIWQAIKKGYYIENDTTIPFLILMLLHTDRDFSRYYFDFVVDKLVKNEIKKTVKTKIENLKKLFFQSSLSMTVLKGAEGFTLDNHWKTSLKIGLAQPEIIEEPFKDLVDFYREIDDTQFQRLKEEITIYLKNHLQNGFKDKADVFLCVDLAKMEYEYLDSATKIYCNFWSLSKLPKDYIDYVREELYELWISTAWKYRAVYDDEKVIYCYENAFDKLGIKTHLKQLSAYAYYLQTRVLPKYKYGTKEFQNWKEKIGSLHNDVITCQLEQGIKDPISYQTLALFYKSVAEHQKAEENFKKSLQIDPFFISTLQAYAIFLKERGNLEWHENQAKALEDYKKAEELFKKGKNKLLELKAEKGELSRDEKEKEKKLLNAYIVFLEDQARHVAEDEKKKYDELIDELFEEVLEKYPDHVESINKYADFLMKYGWIILPKYKNGKNLKKAEELIRDHIAICTKKGEPFDPVSLHTLGILLYKFKPMFTKQPPDFQQASELLTESTKTPNPKHNSIAYHELARLYMKWADHLKLNSNEYNAKMELAKKAIQKALELPENPFHFITLSRICVTYAFYFIYRGQIEQARIYRDKAFEFVKLTPVVPLYNSFNSMGDKLIEEKPEEAIDFFLKAVEVGKEWDINNQYSYFKLGECHKRLAVQKTNESIEFTKHVEDALENYLSSARAENISQGYGTRRNSIRLLMGANEIRKERSPELYHKCIQARVECSKKAFQLDPDNRKNCGNYGEDLLLAGEYESAISKLEKGVNLFIQSSGSNGKEKREDLSWFYEKIEFCYKFRRNALKTEKIFSKKGCPIIQNRAKKKGR